MRRSLFWKKEFDEENIPAVQRVFYPCAFVFGSLRKKIVQGSDQNRKFTETLHVGRRPEERDETRTSTKTFGERAEASPLVVPVIARFFCDRARNSSPKTPRL